MPKATEAVGPLLSQPGRQPVDWNFLDWQISERQ